MGLPFRSRSWPGMEVFACVSPDRLHNTGRNIYCALKVIDNRIIFFFCSHIYLFFFFYIFLRKFPERVNIIILGSVRIIFQLKTLHVERQKNLNKASIHFFFKPCCFSQQAGKQQADCDHCRKERKPQRSLRRIKGQPGMYSARVCACARVSLHSRGS